MDVPSSNEPPDDLIRRMERRAERERNARIAAEKLLEQKSRELYLANQQLKSLAAGLEQRVEERTRELVDAREQAVKLSERDHLTGLANRSCFVRALCEAIERWHEGNSKFALLLIDLDRFKEINDTVGHDAGDAFLQHAAAHIKEAVRGHDVVARLGGDEFAVICNGVECAGDVRRVAERILIEFEKPLHYRNRILSASCSIGFAVFPDDASNVTDLQRFADIALYRSKAGGRSAFTAFSATMSEEINRRQTLEQVLRVAVKNGEIEPWYQPIVEVVTGKPFAAEVLARWRVPNGSVLQPAKFMDVLEECGLMRDLFRSILRTSCNTARPWIEQGHIEFVSVNVSPSQLKLGSLVEDVESILAESKFPYASLQLEITEDALLSDLKAVSVQLEDLTARGVKVALDDFGSGYSSIGYLRHLPIHTLKLDRSLTCDVVSDSRARAIVSAINEIAKALGVGLLAEGVETEAQALMLGRAGCCYLQGYLFGRPTTSDEFAARISASRMRTAQWG
jgi:diguanylate cyclase (GGDEF)-like protein